ncbi:acyl carrier protein [Saccharopolyspora phatthalungensis]|uniref:Acyl carrier protein n=1 Tax=Saccharopolyspora phatthalungensis TaxID=664693 RepID=A0A840QJV1_9PSEU|nr:acyl carrier protein [Saccharopolyspora phatthalungensis]MBB5159489.1 acyl carrier protein [Saccharopolyspora phatthalungensis]
MSTAWTPEFDAVVRAHLPDLSAESPLTPELSLADCGLDSMGIVALLVALEEALALTFPDELLTPETFATPTSLWTAVQKAPSTASG